MTTSGEQLSRSGHAIQASPRPPYRGVFVTWPNGDFGLPREGIDTIISNQRSQACLGRELRKLKVPGDSIDLRRRGADEGGAPVEAPRTAFQVPA